MINKEQNFSKQWDVLQTLNHSDSGTCLEKGLWDKANSSDDQVNKTICHHWVNPQLQT